MSKNRLYTTDVPAGELREIDAPMSCQLWIGGKEMGSLSQTKGTVKLRGSEKGTQLRSREQLTYTVVETPEEYRERTRRSDRPRGKN